MMKRRSDTTIQGSSVKISELSARIQQQTNGGTLFKQNFLVLVSTALVYYGTTCYVNQSLLDAIENVHEATQFDWCSPVLAGLVKAKRKWKPGGAFGGSLPFLLLFYLDHVKYQVFYVERTVPSFIGWTDDIVADRITAETKKSEFGKELINQDRPQRPTLEDVHVHYNHPDDETDEDIPEHDGFDGNSIVRVRTAMKRMRRVYDDILRLVGDFQGMYATMKDSFREDPKVVHLTLSKDRPSTDQTDPLTIPYWEDPANLEFIDILVEMQNRKSAATNTTPTTDAPAHRSEFRNFREKDAPSFSLGLTQLEEEEIAAVK